MARDPFSVMGLSRNCTQAEAQERYVELRERYKKDRFLDGEAGNAAARNLQELEDAYGAVLDILSQEYTVDGTEDVYARVASEVKNGNYDSAQSALDAITARDGEWHYYQALILYKKGDYVEARKQLQMAITLEPNNQKFNDTLQKLEAKMSKDNPFGPNNDNQNTEHRHHRSYRDPAYSTSRADDADTCCRVCNTLICIDCCCEMMGGDCITCC